MIADALQLARDALALAERLASAAERIAAAIEQQRAVASVQRSANLRPADTDRRAAARALTAAALDRRTLLDRGDAAAYLGVSARTFDRHVAPLLRSVPIGSVTRYDRKDLDEWLEQQKLPGSWSATSARVSTSSASGMEAESTLDPRARQFLRRLRSGPRRSTTSKSADDDPRS